MNRLTRFLTKVFTPKTVYVPYPSQPVYSHVVQYRDSVILVSSNGDITQLNYDYTQSFIQLQTVRKA
jgi:hypothetical protein